MAEIDKKFPVDYTQNPSPTENDPLLEARVTDKKTFWITVKQALGLFKIRNFSSNPAPTLNDSLLEAQNSNGDTKYISIQQVHNLLTGYIALGVATYSSTPATIAGQKSFYFASTSGTYANFNNIVVNANEFCALAWNGSSWSKWILLSINSGTGATMNDLYTFQSYIAASMIGVISVLSINPSGPFFGQGSLVTFNTNVKRWIWWFSNPSNINTSMSVYIQNGTKALMNGMYYILHSDGTYTAETSGGSGGGVTMANLYTMQRYIAANMIGVISVIAINPSEQIVINGSVVIWSENKWVWWFSDPFYPNESLNVVIQSGTKALMNGTYYILQNNGTYIEATEGGSEESANAARAAMETIGIPIYSLTGISAPEIGKNVLFFNDSKWSLTYTYAEEYPKYHILSLSNGQKVFNNVENKYYILNADGSMTADAGSRGTE